jgi:ribosome-associated protein
MPTKAKSKPHPAINDIQAAVNALKDKKAENIRVLNVAEQSSITDFLILATGTSEPHVKALKATLDESLKASGVHLIGQERELGSGWLVVDAFDFMVHLQTETMRSFYRLDQLWKDAGEVTL